MRCPYCGKEMEDGWLKSSAAIHWGKEHTLGFIQEDIKLTGGFWKGLWRGFFAKAHRCGGCGAVILVPKE
jgi:hypothetical protein